MELAYLGLFSKIFNWVMDKIFDPVFKFISDLLSTVFSWVFNEILAPILFPILEEVLEFAIDLYTTIYSFQIYSLFAGVLKIIDYLEIAFDVFIGRRDVTYVIDKNTKISGSLLEILVQHEMVSKVFWVLTLSGFGIAMILTIFGTAKSAFDLDFENKRPVSKVLTAMMKCFIQFFTVPLFVYFMLILATDILRVATDTISGNTATTLGRIVFMIASLNASRTKSLNADFINGLDPKDARRQITLGTTPEDTVRFPFYTTNSYTWKGKTVEPIDYINVKAVNSDFNLADFDYLIGFLAAIFLFFIMAVCIITFVQRIFEIVLLYIVSPYFVSTMPLDDGERFGRWRDLFIGKCFTGYGSAIGMRLYLVVCQMIMAGNIKFTDAKLVSSIEIDYFMKLFFLLGGAWAVFKSGPMITQILSASAGQQEASTQAVAGGALYGHTIGKAMNAGKGAISSLGRKGVSALMAKGSKKADPKQKFEGSKNDAKWKKGAASQSGVKQKVKPQWKAGVKPTGERGSKMQIGAHRAGGAAKAAVKPSAKPAALRQRRASMSDLSSMKAAATAARARRASFSAGQKITTPLKPLDLKTAKAAPKIKPGRLAMSKDAGMMAAAKAATAAVGTSKVIPEKEKKNFRFGRMLQSTYDANGNHKIRVLGVGVDRDASGNTMAFQMKLGGLRVQRTDPNQSMQLARMHIPGITRINSNVQGGQLKYSDISVLHGAVRYRNNESGSQVRVLGGLTNVEYGQQGTDVRVLGGLTRVHHGDDGTHVRVLGGLTDVKYSQQDGANVSVMGGVTRVHHGDDGTNVSVLGGVTRVHHGDDGTNVRVMGGLTQVDHTAQGTHVGVMGDHLVSVRTKGDNLQALKVGVLEYSRSGVVKKVPPSAVFGSAPTVSASTGSVPTMKPTQTTTSSTVTTTSGGSAVQVKTSSTVTPSQVTSTQTTSTVSKATPTQTTSTASPVTPASTSQSILRQSMSESSSASSGVSSKTVKAKVTPTIKTGTGSKSGSDSKPGTGSKPGGK